VNAEDVVAELSKVFASRDWTAMRELYHPDAMIVTVTGGPEPLGPDAVIAELERASDDLVYLVTAADTLPIDDHAAIVTGRMRRRLPERGFEDAAHVWLLTVREGLVYRQAVYHDASQARDAYELRGVSLGMGDA
jgi:SnoaL-like protein